jgi:hypothetical protein
MHAGAGAAAPSPRGGRVASRVQLVLHAMGGGKGGGKGEGGGRRDMRDTEKAKGYSEASNTRLFTVQHNCFTTHTHMLR